MRQCHQAGIRRGRKTWKIVDKELQLRFKGLQALSSTERCLLLFTCISWSNERWFHFLPLLWGKAVAEKHSFAVEEE